MTAQAAPCPATPSPTPLASASTTQFAEKLRIVHLQPVDRWLLPLLLLLLLLLLLPSLICAFHSCPNVQHSQGRIEVGWGNWLHFLLHCIHCGRQQQSSVRAHCSLTVDARGSSLPASRLLFLPLPSVSGCLSFWHLPGCRLVLVLAVLLLLLLVRAAAAAAHVN